MGFDEERSFSAIRLQLFILGAFRFSEAIAWTSIFPYIYFMLQSFNAVPDERIPFYAGLLVAVFTFCEFLSGMVWAKVSDSIGRKVTLVLGVACGIVTTLCFGFSKSLGAVVTARALGGLLNPNVGVVQTCVGEIAGRKKGQAKAFSYIPFLRGLGALIGPFLGGVSADPVTLYPALFPANSIWATYPCLLPNTLVAAISFLTMIVGILFLKETHPDLPPRRDIVSGFLRTARGLLVGKPGFHGGQRYTRLPGDESNSDSIETQLEQDNRPVAAEGLEMQSNISESSTLADDSLRPVVPKTAFTAQVLLQVLSVSLLAFHKVSSDAIMPTFLALPQPKRAKQETGFLHFSGGFGLTTQHIGYILLAQACVAIIAQLAVIPGVVDRFGALRTYRYVLCAFPFMYLCTPFVVKLSPPLSTIALVLDLCIKIVLSSTGYVCSAILITNTSPSPSFLARINGAAASFGCLARSIGPLVSGQLLGWSNRVGYIVIAFWVLSAVSGMGALESFGLRDQP